MGTGADRLLRLEVDRPRHHQLDRNLNRGIIVVGDKNLRFRSLPPAQSSVSQRNLLLHYQRSSLAITIDKTR
ncbi:hypothetical protein BDM02DRAFT_3121032 [Thelephora ganbajun]|uniref:Uncharacterized protein n=1 Tax=Thelephora ganbajun TaxID=370292 RepID=A0ACB6Z5X0_THEGA|nr:hypothetical protein BDM02DRAFT_3121032 [Thelephora ganbajun]